MSDKLIAEDIIDGHVSKGVNIGGNIDNKGTIDNDRGGGGGGIFKVAAVQMSTRDNSAPVVLEEGRHRATTTRPSAKQMGRDPDTHPKILYPGGLFDQCYPKTFGGNISAKIVIT